MARVFLAFDEEIRAEVALKTLGPLASERLLAIKREFRELAEVVHPNLVELYELLVTDRESFFTMEYVDGAGFVDHVRADGSRFVDAAGQLVGGLAAVHAAGKLHRDVKPANVLVSREGRVVLLDFGLASVVGASDSAATLAGTLDYMAPEQAWGGPLRAAADWYAVGVMLYEALTGRVPFSGDAVAMLAAKARGRPIPAARIARDVSPEIDELVLDLLDPDPAKRPDAAEILDRLASARPAGAMPPPLASEDPPASFFVGRERELARLGELFTEAAAGGFRAVRVSGPSGIGKTALVRRFVADAAARGALVLRGRCHPNETVPHNAFDSVVDDVARALAESPIEAASTIEHTAELVRVFPVLTRIVAFRAGLDAEPSIELHELRRRAFAAFRELLAALAARQPLVVWIDDAQWSDTDSRRLLGEILRRPGTPRSLWITTERSTAAVDAAEDRGGSELEHIETLDLGPLDRAASSFLVREILGRDDDTEERVRAIVDECDGSPLFLAQLARHGAAPGRGARPRLSELLRERIGGVAAEPRAMLELLAVAASPLDRAFALSFVPAAESPHRVIGTLVRSGLVRPMRIGERPGFEIQHDRVRELVSESLGADALRARHATLAAAHERQSDPEPEPLFRHLVGAERPRDAAPWAVRAADRAAAALAFERAATLYGRAIELAPWPDAELSSLHTRRGDALVGAGRSAEAARSYVAAAGRASGADGVELRRRAADHFLISGEIDTGIAELERLLRELDLPAVPSTRAAQRHAAAGLLRLAARGAFRRRVSPTAPAAIDLARIDACHSAFRGFAQIDPMKGPYYAVRQLLLALDRGDEARIALGRHSVGVFLAVVGGPLGRWGERLLAEGARYAERSGDPYLGSVAGFSRAAVASERGDWPEVRASGWQAFDALRANCRGVRWETNIARMLGLRGLEETGDLTTYARRAEEWLLESEGLGDVYGSVTARWYLAIARIAADDVAGARAEVDRALGDWAEHTTPFQEFYAIRAHARCDLYEGDAERALRRIEEAWPTFRSSGLLVGSIYRYDAYTLRAHASLALLAARPTRRLRRAILADARRLGREHRPDAIAQAELIRAAVAAQAGDDEEAATLLASAAGRFDAARMEILACGARVRRGEVVGGEAGTAEARAGLEGLRARGIREPERWLRIHAAGFGSTTR